MGQRNGEKKESLRTSDSSRGTGPNGAEIVGKAAGFLTYYWLSACPDRDVRRDRQRLKLCLTQLTLWNTTGLMFSRAKTLRKKLYRAFRRVLRQLRLGATVAPKTTAGEAQHDEPRHEHTDGGEGDLDSLVEWGAEGVGQAG